MGREPYPSDLSDVQWALIEPMITAWKQDRSQYRPVAALNAQLKARPCGRVFAMRSHDQIGFGPPDLAECVDQNAAHAPCWTTELEPEADENATSTGQDGASMPPSPTRGPTCPSGELRA